MRAVVDTHRLVCMPVITSVAYPRRRSPASRSVPMKALFTDFCTATSPGSGRTSGLISQPGWCGRSGDSGSRERCCTWIRGRPVLRQPRCNRAMLASSAGLLRCSASLKRSKPFCTSTTRSTAFAGQRVGNDEVFRRSAALQCDCALEVQACLAHNLHAIAGNFALHRSTASTQLLRPQRLLTQSPGPIWCECALYRTASGVLINADGRVKEAADVVYVGPAGSGNKRSADPAVEVGKSRNVGGERSHLP